jgi:hypothetical protein
MIWVRDEQVGIGTDSPKGAFDVMVPGYDLIEPDQGVLENGYATLFAPAIVNWQSFKAGETGILAKIDIKPPAAVAGLTMTLKVYTGEGVSGSPIYSKAFTFPDALHEYYSIRIVEKVQIQAGSKYTWAIQGGSVFSLYGHAGEDDCYIDGYSSAGGMTDPNDDFWFKTYVRVPDMFPGLLVQYDELYGLTQDGTVGIALVGVGTQEPKAAVDIAEGSLRIQEDRTPTYDTPCLKGEFAWDEWTLYLCVADNHWKMVGLQELEGDR